MLCAYPKHRWTSLLAQDLRSLQRNASIALFRVNSNLPILTANQNYLN